jgi:hypothetical protein
LAITTLYFSNDSIRSSTAPLDSIAFDEPS